MSDTPEVPPSGPGSRPVACPGSHGAPLGGLADRPVQARYVGLLPELGMGYTPTLDTELPTYVGDIYAQLGSLL